MLSFVRAKCILLSGCITALVLFSACSSIPASSGSVSSANIPSQTPANQEQLDALEDALVPMEERCSSFEILEMEILSESAWETAPMLDQAIDTNQITWREYLKASPSRSLFSARIDTTYTTETKILGPQSPDGEWSVWGVMEEKGDSLLVEHTLLVACEESSTPSATDPQAAEMDLTTDQWEIMQRQLRALITCGIWKDYSTPADWNDTETANWLALRLKDWPNFDANPIPLSSCSVVLQADFSAENGTWGNNPTLLPESLRMEKELALPELTVDAQQFMDEHATVEYRRVEDTIVADVTIDIKYPTHLENFALDVTEDGQQPIQMQYTFGLVPDNTGPVSRTWLKQAVLIAE